MCFNGLSAQSYLTDFFASANLYTVFSKIAHEDGIISQKEWDTYWKTTYEKSKKVKAGEWPHWG